MACQSAAGALACDAGVFDAVCAVVGGTEACGRAAAMARSRKRTTRGKFRTMMVAAPGRIWCAWIVNEAGRALFWHVTHRPLSPGTSLPSAALDVMFAPRPFERQILWAEECCFGHRPNPAHFPEPGWSVARPALAERLSA